MDIQTQTQDKMQEMLASKLMDKRNEMFHDITGGDECLTQDIIRLVCTATFQDIQEFWDLRESSNSRFISALGPKYEGYCQQLVLDDIAAEDEYAKDAAVEMEIEQRRLNV